MVNMKLVSGKPNKNKEQNTSGKAAKSINKHDNANNITKKGPAQKRGKGKSPRSRKPLLALCAVFTALFVGFLVIGAYANGLDVVFPNVSMEGIDLSGMTITQAADTLYESGIETKGGGNLTVLLPANIELNVDKQEAGLHMSAADAAVFVFESCHGGSFLGNTITYLRSLVFGMQLTISDGAQLDEVYLRNIVSDAAKEVGIALLESDIEIDEFTITIIKGALSTKVDVDHLYETVKAALLDGSFGPIDYTGMLMQNGAESEAMDLQELYDTIFLEPQNAVFDPETQAATEHVIGRSFDIEMAQRLWDQARNGDKIVIPLVLVLPDITTERLNNMLFADVLAQKSTPLAGSSSARINNIRLAAAAINGLILNPGEEFSFNGVVGQRTAAKGYQAAGAFIGGQVVDVIGGGICQVSSTLYFAAMVSNLEITDRTNHMFRVYYLPAGLDAAVSWPSLDFRFRNSSEFPIKIEAFVDGGNHTVRILGSNPEGIRVEMATETWQTANGSGAVSFRLVFDRYGNLISRTEEARSHYTFRPAPEPDDPPAPEDEDEDEDEHECELYGEDPGPGEDEPDPHEPDPGTDPDPDPYQDLRPDLPEDPTPPQEEPSESDGNEQQVA